MENTVKERLINYLLYKKITRQKFANDIGVSSAYVDSIRKSIQPSKITIIAKQYPDLNTGWLLTGEGSMLKEESSINIAPNEKGVPYFDIETAACGAFVGFGQGLEKSKASGYMYVPQIPTKDGDLFIQAQGRSMIDTVHTDKSISNGAWVCIREWKAGYIQWGEVYAIATHEGYAVKKLLPSDKEGYIKCVSSNEAEGYYPYELNLEFDVIGLAKVIGVANFKVF